MANTALHTAFYPGSYPFSAGWVARITGALSFYLVKAHAFIDGNKRTGALANIIEKCAASEISKDYLIEWFDKHKVKLAE